MPYVVRRKDSEEYLTTLGGYSELHEAHFYASAEEAHGEANDDEEVMEVRVSLVNSAPIPPKCET